MEALFSTVFVAVLALFGLLVAALIYVAQTVQDRYSTRLAQKLLRGRLSSAFWVFGFLTLISSSAGLFAEAYPHSSMIIRSGLAPILASSPYGAAALLAALVSLVLFIFTLRNYARLLSPLTVLEEIARDLNPFTVRDIALLRLHEETEQLETSEAIRDFLRQFEDNPSEEPQKQLSNQPSKRATPIFRVKSLFQRVTESYRKSRPTKIQHIKDKLAAKERRRKLEDPFGDLLEYALSAITRNNALAWHGFCRQLVELFNNSARRGFLDERAEIPFPVDTLTLQGLERLQEEIEITRRFSMLLELNQAVQGICEAFASVGSWNRLVPFLSFLEDIGVKALLRKDRGVFQSSVGVLTSLGVLSMKEEPNSQIFDDVCRKIGWLGEKLVLRGIEESPAMPSGNESAELGQITETIYKMKDSVCESKTDKYPHILRDAIEVVCNQALQKNEPKKFEESLLNLFGIHTDLAENLINKESGNAETYLWLVLHYFKDVLDKYDLSDYRELRKDVFSWVGYLSQAALGHNQAVKQFWGATIPGDRDLCGLIISFIVQMGEPEDWDAPMRNTFTKADRHHDGAWDFVKRAGVQLNSNFGLMFDPATGEDYAPNDPRRR